MNAIAENLSEIEKRDPATPPPPGELWPEQGGRYVGPYVKDGQLRHGISVAGVENDIPCSFDTQDEKTAGIVHNGFSDWRVPDQRETMLAYIHARDDFHTEGIESVYLTSAPYGSSYAWAVTFENGNVSPWGRNLSFRVRLFRSIIA